jgi:hypothetical protein
VLQRMTDASGGNAVHGLKIIPFNNTHALLLLHPFLSPSLPSAVCPSLPILAIYTTVLLWMLIPEPTVADCDLLHIDLPPGELWGGGT